jgi:uncharacterized membrane protein
MAKPVKRTNMGASQILYGLSVLLSGLVAGLFYGYQCSVINGLGALGDKEYLAAFQSINRAILNPLFFLSFMGSVILLPITTYVIFGNGYGNLFPYLLAATCIYVAGVFLVTMVFNVPLNNSVASFDLRSASSTELQNMRQQFEASWNKWHLVRTLASVACFIVLIIPLIRKI